jgi:L-ascorbate metabolism protein UlaG (beta-lactamase superfamily)
MYRVAIGDVRLAIIGNIAGNLDESQLESIGVVDMVVLPVGGGGYTLDGDAAAKLIRQIDPKAVVPVHYAESSLTYEVPQDSLQDFVNELGVPVETVEKYKLKSAATLPATLTVIEVRRN